MSVTEKEIYNGILNAKNLANNVLFFEREIVDIEQNIQSNRSLASKFIDLDDKFKVDEHAKSFLNNLKYSKIPSRLPSSNIFKLKVLNFSRQSAETKRIQKRKHIFIYKGKLVKRRYFFRDSLGICKRVWRFVFRSSKKIN